MCTQKALHTCNKVDFAYKMVIGFGAKCNLTGIMIGTMGSLPLNAESQIAYYYPFIYFVPPGLKPYSKFDVDLQKPSIITVLSKSDQRLTASHSW